MSKFIYSSILSICTFVLATVAYASYVPVGVLIKAENCPPGTMLIVNDVETNIFVDSRGKLTTMINGMAGYSMTTQMHNVPEGKSYSLVTTTASMNLKIFLDCTGTNHEERQGL